MILTRRKLKENLLYGLDHVVQEHVKSDQLKPISDIKSIGYVIEN